MDLSKEKNDQLTQVRIPLTPQVMSMIPLTKPPKILPKGSLAQSRRNIRGTEEFKVKGTNHKACMTGIIEEKEGELEKILNWTKNLENMLIISGAPGGGKSYLIAALLNYFWEQLYEVYYIHWRNLLQNIQEEFKNDQNSYTTLEKFGDQDILILDDIGSSRLSDWQKDQLLDLIDLRTEEHGLPTIITTNFNQEQIKKEFGERIESRLFARKNLIVYRNVDRRQWDWTKK